MRNKPMKYHTFLLIFIAIPIGAAPQSTVKSGDHTETLVLDLPTSLQLVDERNSELAIRVQKVIQSELALHEAYYNWLPTVRAGFGYSYQNGALQNTEGSVGDVRRNARSGGLGIAQMGAGPPLYPGVSMEINLADAVYAPKIADKYLKASQADMEETIFIKTLEVTHAYYDLVLAQQTHALQALSLAEAETLADASESFADAGVGFQADADRAGVEKLLNQARMESAGMKMDESSANIRRILNIRESIQIKSSEETLIPLRLFAELPGQEEAISQAFENRTAIAALERRLEARNLELRRENTGPFIPRIGAAYSYGSFAGAPDSVGGAGSPRHDLTVGLYFQVDNLGFMNRSNAGRRKSERREIEASLDQLRTDIAAEISLAIRDIESTSRQMDILSTAVERARKSYELTRNRIFQNQGQPLDALNAFQSIVEMELLYAQAVTRHNQAQIYLSMATGRSATQVGITPEKL